jgi:cytidylate kinase
MNVVIGLVGKSGVGKTVVAEALARRLGVAVRHCGEVVKRRADELKVAFHELPKKEHYRIDAETIELARNATGLVIMEGRFLDVVLRGVPNVLLVHLTASREELLRRKEKRGRKKGLRRAGSDGGADSGELLHRRKGGKRGTIIVNTDSLTVSGVATQILKYIQAHFHDAA